MAVDSIESRHLVVNEVHGELDPLLDNTDSLYRDKEAKKKLKLSDYFNITMLALTVFNHGIGYAIISSFFPVYAVKQKGLTISEVGIIMSSLSFTTIIFGIVFSFLLSRIGSKRMLMISLLLEAFSVLSFAFVTNIPTPAGFFVVCIICRVTQGIGFVANQVSTYFIAVNEYSDRMSTLMGILEMAIGAGVSIGPAIGGFLYTALGFGSPLYCLSGATTILLVLSYFLVSDDHSYAGSQTRANAEEITTTNELHLNRKTIFKVPGVFLILLAVTILTLNLTYFDVSLSPFLSKTFKISSSMIGLVYLCSVSFYTISCPFIGIYIDRKGSKGLTIMTGFAIVVPAFLFVGPVPFLHIPHNIWVTTVSLTVLFLGSAFMFVPVIGICFDVILSNNFIDSEETKGFLTRIFIFATNFGAFLGPFLGGFILEAFGFKYGGLFFSVLTATSGIALAIYLLKVRSKKRTST